MKRLDDEDKFMDYIDSVINLEEDEKRKNTQRNNMKILEVDEYTYVLHKYPGTIEVSNEDYENFKKGKISQEEILRKYEIEFSGYSKPDYDVTYDELNEYEVYTNETKKFQ